MLRWLLSIGCLHVCLELFASAVLMAARRRPQHASLDVLHWWPFIQTPRPTATVAAPSVIRPLFADPIDPPTISMSFGVNDSLLAGKDGTKLTASMILERLEREAASNVGLEIASSPPQQGMSDAAEVRVVSVVSE